MKRTFTAILSASLILATACRGDDKSAREGAGTTIPEPAKPVTAKPETATPASATKATLALNWVPYGEHAPFYYGLRKGFYAAEGIDLTIQPGKGSGATIQQVAQKNVAIGWADAAVMTKSVAAGMKVKCVGSFLQKGPSSIEFLAEKEIKTPADLKGKKVGGTPGDALYAVFPAWLKANNLYPADVTVVNLEPAGKIAALADGKVDAIMGFFHDQGPTIEGRTGKKVNHLLYADSGLNLLGNGIVVHEDTIRDKPDLVRKVVAATQKSWAEAVKDVEGAVAAMAEMAENEPPVEVLTKQLTLAIPLLELDKAGAPGVNTEASWSATLDLLSKYGNLPDPGAPARYWDGSFAASK